MKKRILVAEFHDGIESYFVIGSRSVHKEMKNETVVFIKSKYIVVDIPGVILGTPNDWYRILMNRVIEEVCVRAKR